MLGEGGPEPRLNHHRSIIHKGQQSIPNKHIGKYNLPHTWDEVLFNTSELKSK